VSSSNGLGCWIGKRERVMVIGFLAHPPFGFSGPSPRDARTIARVVDLPGQPLLCLIEVPTGLNCLFVRNGSEMTVGPLPSVQRFERGVMVIVGEGTMRESFHHEVLYRGRRRLPGWAGSSSVICGAGAGRFEPHHELVRQGSARSG